MELMANFIDFLLFFTSWGAESFLKPTICLKSAKNVCLVAGGTSKSVMSLVNMCASQKICGKMYGFFRTDYIATVSYWHC